MAVSTAGKTTYELGYDDPEADWVLKTIDGKLFRVHSYHLKSARQVNVAFFRTLPSPHEVPLAVSGEAPVIEFRGLGDKVERLLDHIIVAAPPPIGKWSDAEAVMDLGKRYQFDRLPALLAPSLNACLRYDSWRVFVFASQHNILSLAKTAIERLHKDTSSPFHCKTTMTNIGPSYFADIPGNYVFALTQAMHKSAADGNGTIDCARAASFFDLA